MNYIPQVAKMLGVEIGERFNIVNGNSLYCEGCYFTNDNFVFGGVVKEATGYSNYDVLARVLIGAWQIKKLPWKPKEDEIYYIPIVAEGTVDSDYYYWQNEQIDLSRYNANPVLFMSADA